MYCLAYYTLSISSVLLIIIAKQLLLTISTRMSVLEYTASTRAGCNDRRDGTMEEHGVSGRVSIIFFSKECFCNCPDTPES